MSKGRAQTFTVRVTGEQAARWQAAAEHEGARTVAAWLASLASARLRELGRYVPRMSLHWRRARFCVAGQGEEGGAREVKGLVAGPFGIHKDAQGGFCLVHAPSGCRLVALPTQRQCKALARELAMCKVTWHTSDPTQITGPDVPRVSIALSQARRAAYGPPL